MSHFLDTFGNFAMGAGWKARLVSIVDFSSVIEEFNHKWCVLPVNVFFGDRSHKAPAQLGTCQGSIEESGRLLHFVLQLLVHLINDVTLRVVAISFNEGCVVSILLLVLPGRRHGILRIESLEARLYGAQRIVNTDILS